jgi:hypothetical protein
VKSTPVTGRRCRATALDRTLAACTALVAAVASVVTSLGSGAGPAGEAPARATECRQDPVVLVVDATLRITVVP